MRSLAATLYSNRPAYKNMTSAQQTKGEMMIIEKWLETNELENPFHVEEGEEEQEDENRTETTEDD